MSRINKRHRRRGQSAVFFALALPFLLAFTLMVVEVAERWLEVAMLEDALQQATRSAVQLLDYGALARGEESLRATRECREVTRRRAGPCQALVSAASRILETNLLGVRGLDEETGQLLDRVRWTILPDGGTCVYDSAAVAPVSETTPLICAEMRPVMRGIVGWGSYTPLIVAADTIDPIR